MAKKSESTLMHQKTFLPKIAATAPAEELKKQGLSMEQIRVLHSLTPTEFLQEREGRGGKTFTYVDVHYVVAVLNFVFSHRWSDAYVDYHREGSQLWVRCTLSVTLPNGVIVSHQATGSGEVKLQKGTNNPVDLGDDWKAVEADALKKAAWKYGIAWDVYAGITVLHEGVQKPHAQKLAAKTNPHNHMMVLARELGLYDEKDRSKWQKTLDNLFPGKVWLKGAPSSTDLTDDEKWIVVEHLEEERLAQTTVHRA